MDDGYSYEEGNMYGTVARLRVKEGKGAEFLAFGRKEDEIGIPGHIGEVIYRMDTDPNEYYMAVFFESKEAYVANANSPEQNERYLEMVALLEGPPEWFDGEIVHAHPELG
jgi:heme-degrading monooxygenase HmoA